MIIDVACENSPGWTRSVRPVCILIVDDHGIVRDGLRSLLRSEDDLKVVGLAATGENAVLAAQRLKPDVIIMDLLLPMLNGIDTTRRIMDSLPKTKIIVLSACATSEHVYRAMRAGALGYVIKDAAASEVVRAVRTVAAGRKYLSPSLATVVSGDRNGTEVHREHAMDDTGRVPAPRYEDLNPPAPHYHGRAESGSTAQQVAAPVVTLVPDAIRDALTGLPTLTYLAGMFARLRRRAQRNHRAFAFITFSIDEFRLVCEAFGREQADEAIKSIASLLRTQLDANAIIVRAGTSTLVVALNGLANASEATRSVHRILQAIARPRNVGGQDLRLTASAGIAIFPTDGGDYETLLRNANAAMRASRAICHGGQRCHAGNDAVSAKRRLQLRTALAHAIEHKQLTLHYQPQFEVRGGRASGVEVLARWFPVDGDAIEPGVFIPLAERSGLIGALGAWVLRQACETAAGWRTCGDSAPTICVNVSTYQIDENLCTVIRQAVERARIPPNQLELEITESSLMRNPDTALECLRQCKEVGVRIAIDDFGTGYSSLSHLSRLPVDRLKIDKSLIYSMTATGKGAALVRSIIALGKDLGIGVIAEGVETWEQFRMLQDLGCLHVQGYLLAPPAPAEDIQALLASHWGMRAVAIPGDS